MCNIFHPDGAVIVDLGVFCDQLPGHQRDVIGAGHVSVHVQAAAVDKGGLVHSKPSGALVHHADKFCFRSRDMFCHGDTGIVCTCDADTFQHSVDRLGFPGLQKYLGTAHAGGVFRDGHGVLRGNLSGRKRIEYQDHRHDFCDAGRVENFVGIFLVNNGSGRSFHQKYARSGNA